MKRKSVLRRILLPVISLVLIVSLGLGIWYYVGHHSISPVSVYAFTDIGITEYWGDTQESYGPVTTDRIQTVYLSDTQTVTEIYVTQGQHVKAGDLLMSFDTTLSDLALERKRLSVEKLKLQLEDARERLVEINQMRPMIIPTPSPDEPDDEVNLGTALKEDYRLSEQSKYDGTTAELALVCWIREETDINDTLLETIRQQVQQFQRKNAALNPPETPDVGEETDDSTEPPTTEITQPPVPDATEPEQTEPAINVVHYYVIFKVTQGDMSLGSRLLWQGLEVFKAEDQTFRFRFFDASGISDHTLPETQPEPTEPEIDFGSGYTAAQIAQMRSEQEKTIRDLEFSVKTAEADYKIMLLETGDGNVYATVDGTVVSLLSEEDAKANGQPLLKVSGGGGFYVEGTVGELDRDALQIGQEVSVMDWNTGMNYVGVITALGDYPSTEENYYGSGNPNVSCYPFTVFIEGDADLQAGTYVSVTYSAGASQQGIYLENPFLRTEQGRSYVYVRGADGMLEKRFVTTGKSLYGSYIEILDGLTAEDWVAFPYGRNLKPGAPTEDGNLADFYNY